MASLGKSNGCWRVQLKCPDGKRRALHLPKKLQKRQAENCVAWIERLAAAACSGQSIDPETAAWLASVDESLHSKLVKCGLARSREATETKTVSVTSLIDGFVNSRRTVKEGTRKRWATVKAHLIEFFGPEKRIDEFTLLDADNFAEFLMAAGVAENTKRRYLGIAKQFFTSAVRGKLIEENPFRDQKVSINGNQEKNRFFLSRESSEQIMETCPDAEWRLIFALMRYGGLRCPSEVQALKWSDVNWERDRFLIHSIKTEHIDGKQTRWCPMFPELRSHFEACFDAAEDGEQFVISKRHCMTHRGLTAQYRQILHHAAVPEYPKLFQNLRSTRQTELAEDFPLHVVTAWIGNSRDVALKHYLQVTDEHFEQAAAKSELVAPEAAELAHKVAQHSQAS